MAYTGIILETKNLQKTVDLVEKHAKIRYLKKEHGRVFFDVYEVKNPEKLLKELGKLSTVSSVKTVPSFTETFGKRVIIIGGGAQVMTVASGAIAEADRHNLRGEKISVDTIPLVGEETLADAIEAVGRLDRVGALVLAGSIMGGKITESVKKIKKLGIPVISLKMIGSAPKEADLIVTDPTQAGVLAVMTVAHTAKFDIKKVKGREI